MVLQTHDLLSYDMSVMTYLREGSRDTQHTHM